MPNNKLKTVISKTARWLMLVKYSVGAYCMKSKAVVRSSCAVVDIGWADQ